MMTTEKTQKITREILIELLDYNPETGIFTWKPRDAKHFNRDRLHKTWNTRFSGVSAGSYYKGYLYIGVFGKLYLSHRLAWLIITGSWPENHIDHINHNRSDNRFCNLRDVTRQENQRNTSFQKNNKSGITGVHLDSNQEKWKVQIRINGKRKCLGMFTSKFSAIKVRLKAEKEYGYHRNHGRKVAELDEDFAATQYQAIPNHQPKQAKRGGISCEKISMRKS